MIHQIGKAFAISQGHLQEYMAFWYDRTNRWQIFFLRYLQSVKSAVSVFLDPHINGPYLKSMVMMSEIHMVIIMPISQLNFWSILLFTWSILLFTCSNRLLILTISPSIIGKAFVHLLKDTVNPCCSFFCGRGHKPPSFIKASLITVFKLKAQTLNVSYW